MKRLSFGEIGEFDCYRIDELVEAQAAQARGEKVMLARPCTKCGDLLFGDLDNPNMEVSCEEGYHNSRPGVWV